MSPEAYAGLARFLTDLKELLLRLQIAIKNFCKANAGLARLMVDIFIRTSNLNQEPGKAYADCWPCQVILGT